MTMFGAIAARYDLINHIISFNTDKTWRKKAADLLAVCKPERILDVACGTADMAIALHKSIAGAQITGIDISTEMLELGRQKIEKVERKGRMASGRTIGPQDRTPSVRPESTPPIILLEGNAETLEFEDSSFDMVTISFGIRNVKDREKALREFHRVLKKRGMLMVLEFSFPRSGIVSLLYKAYFYMLLPLIGGILSGNFKAYSYFVRSVRDFPAPVEFVNMLIKCGYHIEYTTPLSGGAAWIYMASMPVDYNFCTLNGLLFVNTIFANVNVYSKTFNIEKPDNRFPACLSPGSKCTERKGKE